jgi:formylglycine-generating enzyme required for sulfatase activity
LGLSILLMVGSGCDRPGTAAPDPHDAQKSNPIVGAQAASNASATAVQVQLVPLTNMVLIRAGTFTRLQHSVTLSRDFWISRHEVTQSEYEALTGTNPSHFKEGGANRPVEKISHYDAMAYCAALTGRERTAGRLPQDYEYRLPTEAEWEYACQAGSTNRFAFGEDPGEADPYAWTAENSDAQTHPVGQKLPNRWGLHDMHGNVWEWCSDWFDRFPPADVRDPSGPGQGKFKVFRGGGWNQDAEFARTANRFMMAPNTGIHFVGFRVALARAGPGRQHGTGP